MHRLHLHLRRRVLPVRLRRSVGRFLPTLSYWKVQQLRQARDASAGRVTNTQLDIRSKLAYHSSINKYIWMQLPS